MIRTCGRDSRKSPNALEIIHFLDLTTTTIKLIKIDLDIYNFNCLQYLVRTTQRHHLSSLNINIKYIIRTRCLSEFLYHAGSFKQRFSWELPRARNWQLLSRAAASPRRRICLEGQFEVGCLCSQNSVSDEMETARAETRFERWDFGGARQSM
jgi:hypothetical protein